MVFVRDWDFIMAVRSLAVSVCSFHNRFDLPQVENKDTESMLAMLKHRLSLLVEESGEHAQDLNKGNVKDAMEELADVAYIAIGSLRQAGKMGIDAMTRVADKNDKKTSKTHTKWFDKIVKRP